MYHTIHFKELIKIKTFLKSTFLFDNVGDDEYNKLTSSFNPRTEKYKRGEIIYSHGKDKIEMGFVTSGECEVENHTADGNKILLNTLKAYDTFGILALFSEETFPTEIRAKRASEILFLDKETLLMLIEKSPKVSLNVIKFLARRVNFLGKKIDTVTQGSVDTKIASYLLSRAKSEGELSFPFNFKKCSEIINCGRASVYRSIDFLKNKGYIKAENKRIYILDKAKLEEFLK